jgi:hypothetical protein
MVAVRIDAVQDDGDMREELGYEIEGSCSKVGGRS